MDPGGSERKLAAILSADVVGYSRLMAQDEADTVRTLGAYRDEMALLVGQHRGRVVDFTGDNLLAEFPTATDAVGCAIAVQGILRVRNAALPADRRMEFRVGVHLGEVRAEGERIYGNGVNVAARLEALAESGEICISGEVHGQVHRKLELACEDLGEQTVKNIPDPVRVFRLRPGADSPTAVPPRRRPSTAVGVAALLLLAVGGWGIWSFYEARSGAPEAVDERFTVPGFGSRPAIAVLPFDNLSGDPDQEYFADGLAEDLITRLSTVGVFPVIARNSSFTYKGQAVDVKRVSRELGARYVVEGSVRRAGNRLRISAQLIDATTGNHVWAETYDRELKDIFSIQDEITEAIVGAMSPQLMAFEQRRVARREPRSLDAYDLTVRGLWHARRSTREENAKARSLFDKAIELDPSLGVAFAGVAWTHFNDVQFQWAASPARSVAELRRTAQRSVSLSPQLPFGQLVLAFAYQLAGERDAMLAAVERAVEIDPSFAVGHASLGMYLAQVGRPHDAFAHVERAERLSPRDPAAWVFDYARAAAHLALGHDEQAAEAAQRSLRQNPDYFLTWAILAASQAHLGRVDQARAAFEEMRTRQPELSTAGLERFFVHADPAWLARLLDGLRAAGWEG